MKDSKTTVKVSSQQNGKYEFVVSKDVRRDTIFSLTLIFKRQDLIDCWFRDILEISIQ